MMKYTVNHYKDFRFPGVSFLVGFMQFIGGLSAEILCILFTSTQTSTLDTIIKFIALGSIANVDNFYAAALPGTYPLKQKPAPLNIYIHKGDPETQNRNNWLKFLRFIYKCIRLLYVSWLFYWGPYLSLFCGYFNTTEWGNYSKCVAQ